MAESSANSSSQNTNHHDDPNSNSQSPSSTHLTQVGIERFSVYIPRTAVSQSDLEIYDNASTGKYTIGLGQGHMSFVSDREDVVSLALTAVDTLVRDAGISYSDIGRLEVGTETILDKSKSIKTYLMQLFADSGNSEVDGLDNTNACYGATAALFNTFAWVESSSWDGRYAIVVATDIAVYEPGPARPTGGAAAVAMLIGRGDHVPIRFEIGLRAICMGNTFDFFKPKVAVEYPVVKGQQTVDTYVRSMDECYDRYTERASKRDGKPFRVTDSVDYCVFHAPFNKMVQRSFARLIYNDFLKTIPNDNSFYNEVEKFRDLPRETSHMNREAQRAFVKLSKPLYSKKCAPGAWLAVDIGNCYKASLYSSLAALVCEKGDNLIGSRILMYSFGSGFASSMFSLRVTSSVKHMLGCDSLRQRLTKRIIKTPEEYVATLKEREVNYGRFNYEPKADLGQLFPGTYYLLSVGENGERTYGQVTPK